MAEIQEGGGWFKSLWGQAQGQRGKSHMARGWQTAGQWSCRAHTASADASAQVVQRQSHALLPNLALEVHSELQETKGVRSKGGPEEKAAAAPEGGNHKGLMEGTAHRSLDMHHNGTLAASSIPVAEIC